MMDSSGASSDELELTLGSTGVASLVDADSSYEISFEGTPPGISHQPKGHSPFALRSQCDHSQGCPHGAGILFRSRISPSPARKTRLRSRRRRRSDQSRLDATDSTTTLGSTFLDGTSLLDTSSVDCSHLTHLDESHYEKEPQEITVSLGHTLHHVRDDEALRRSLTPKKKKKEVRYEDQEYSSLTSNITNITSLSHSQETSQVDFRMTENPQIESVINGGFIAPTDTIVASTPTKTKPPTVTDSSESGFEEGVPDKSKKASTSGNFLSGSKFFAHFRTPQSQTYSSTSDYFTDFTGTDTPSKLRESTRRLSVRKPFNPYIAYSSDEELDEWMKNPKTDYTYSASLTYRKRVTPERKVGSPNMSRKGLRGNIDYNQSSDFSDHSFSIDATNYGKTYQNYRSSGLPMDALSDSESESPPVATRTRNSRSASIDQRPNSNGSIITTVTQSNYTTTKKTFLQGGLDEQSGEDSQEEIAPLPSLRFRTGTPLTASRSGTPLIASRGGTPLVRRSCTPQFTSHTHETNTRHTNTLTSTPEEEEEKTLYRKIGSIPSAACRTVVLSSKWVFSYIVTSVILMATKTTAYLSSSKSSSTANADKLTSLADSNSSHISSSTKSESAFDRFFTTVTTVITTITTTTTEEITESTSGSLESVTTKVKRRPRLLFWIPLLLLLLLLAYWWLFLAPATGDDVGETQSLGHLLTLPFIKLYHLSSWLALSAYDGLLFAATKSYDLTSWLALRAYDGLLFAASQIYDLTLWLTFGTYNRIVWLASSSPEALITASSNTFNTLASVLTSSYTSTSKSVIALKNNAYFYSSETISGAWLGTQNTFSYIWLSSLSFMNGFWLGTQIILNYLWLSSISIMNGCWSFILTCLAYLLDLFYLIYGTLQGIGLSLYGVLLSGASVFSTSPLSSEPSNGTLTEDPDTLASGYENDGTQWSTFAVLTQSTSEIIIGTTQGLSYAALTSHNWIWSSWVGIIGTVGETLADVSGYTISTLKSVSSSSSGLLDTFWEYTSWGFLSMWSLMGYLWTGLWSGLLYLLTSLWAFLTSFTFTVGEFASGTAAALSNTIGLISLPTIGYFKSSPVNEVPPVVVAPSSDLKTAAPQPQIALESMVEDIVDRVLGSSRLQDKLQILSDTHNKEEDVSALVRSVIEQEVSLVRAEATVLKKEVASISSDSVQILGLKEQQTSLVNQLNMLAAAVENTSESTDKQHQFNDQLNGLRDQINLLSQELQNLQKSHTNLESEVSSCCKRASLTLEDVERHVNTLLGDILGFSAGDNTTGETGEKPMATSSDLNAWLKSYFVAKHELEARLSALADSMEKATPLNIDLPKETMEQTTQMVMETVMDKIRDEIRIQQDKFSSETKESLNEQVKAHVQEQVEGNVKVQVEAAAGKLKEQMVLDVQEHVKVSTEEMGSSLNADVNSLVAESVSRELAAAVPLAVSSAIPDAVASQVDGVVEKVVTSQVNGVVEKVIASQVDGVIEKVVASQVNGVVEKVVAIQVDGAVEKAVASKIDGVVENAVTSQVNGVVEKVVASKINGVVEKLVISQVNGVVETAVASQVEGAVEKVVASHVDGVIEKVVAGQVSGVVEQVVASQVDVAVEKAVTSQVNAVVEKVIEESVESSVKTMVSKEISSALAESVNSAVDDAISSSLPDAVAVSLPGMVNVAVSSTINETVIKAAGVAVAAAVGSLPQLNINERTKENLEANVGNIQSSGKMTANISLSSSNGGNSSFGVLTASGLNEKEVQRIVKEALTMYDADKTGMVDHALESAGGNIISTRCTEGYQVHMAEVSILGWPIYRYSINNPRTIIQPDVMPGQCWAFKGSQGYIVIQLAGPVRPTGFTMEHIPKTLSPSGSIDSAPREFSVWGLVSENGEEIELGSYEYVHDGESLQYFSIKEGVIPNDMYFPIVELKIKSNHGNMKYTCLYRFRVHGVRYF